MTKKEVLKPTEEHKSSADSSGQPNVATSIDSVIHNSERICTYCGTEVMVGDFCCHKCGVDYEQE